MERARLPLPEDFLLHTEYIPVMWRLICRACLDALEQPPMLRPNPTYCVERAHHPAMIAAAHTEILVAVFEPTAWDLMMGWILRWQVFTINRVGGICWWRAKSCR